MSEAGPIGDQIIEEAMSIGWAFFGIASTMTRVDLTEDQRELIDAGMRAGISAAVQAMFNHDMVTLGNFGGAKP